MIELIWSGRAQQDVAGIVGRLHRLSPRAANEFEQRIFRAVAELSTLHSVGHRRPDLTIKNVLFHLVPPHVIVFRRTPEKITVARVLHSARDLGNLI